MWGSDETILALQDSLYTRRPRSSLTKGAGVGVATMSIGGPDDDGRSGEDTVGWRRSPSRDSVRWAGEGEVGRFNDGLSGVKPALWEVAATTSTSIGSQVGDCGVVGLRNMTLGPS